MVIETFDPALLWHYQRLLAHHAPHIEQCTDALNKSKHEPHVHVPGFVDDPGTASFICGGWPRKIVDIEERRTCVQT